MCLRKRTSPARMGIGGIAAGIIDGLGSGDNAKAALLTRGLVEITRLGVAMGARQETFIGLSGMGDLVTTCVSPKGRNRTFGQMLAQGKSVAQVLAEIPGQDIGCISITQKPRSGGVEKGNGNSLKPWGVSSSTGRQASSQRRTVRDLAATGIPVRSDHRYSIP